MGQMFDSLGNNQKRQNPMQMLQSLKSNPALFAQNMGFNIPSNIDFSNPQAIIGALMQSGQVKQNAYNQGMMMMSQFSKKR